MSLLDNDPIDPVAYVKEKFKLAADAVVDPALAKSKYEADEFIKMKNAQFDTLSADYQRLKADYDARASLEELLTKAQNFREESPPPNANTSKPTQPDLSEIERLVESKLTAREKQRLADENLKKSKELVREKYGSKSTEFLRNKMEELDLTEEEMNAWAARSPKSFIRTLGLDDPAPQQSFQTPPASRYNSAQFKPTTEKRTWSYYQDLKAKDPKAWLDPKIQTQMYHDAQRLGAEFGDGDFNQYDERLT
jgi:curved DNA-binding protein CbpA